MQKHSRRKPNPLVSFTVSPTDGAIAVPMLLQQEKLGAFRAIVIGWQRSSGNFVHRLGRTIVKRLFEQSFPLVTKKEIVRRKSRENVVNVVVVCASDVVAVSVVIVDTVTFLGSLRRGS